MTDKKSRAEYFAQYNQTSKVKSFRPSSELLQQIENVVIQQHSTFNNVVLQLIQKGLGVNESVIQQPNVVLQLKSDIDFLMQFFQDRKDVLQPTVTDVERNRFRQIVERMNHDG